MASSKRQGSTKRLDAGLGDPSRCLRESPQPRRRVAVAAQRRGRRLLMPQHDRERPLHGAWPANRSAVLRPCRGLDVPKKRFLSVPDARCPRRGSVAEYRGSHRGERNVDALVGDPGTGLPSHRQDACGQGVASDGPFPGLEEAAPPACKGGSRACSKPRKVARAATPRLAK